MTKNIEENTPKTRKKRKKRMRLPNGIGSVHHINDGKARRRPYRARVPAHVELDAATGTAKQKYITIGYFEKEADAIEALFEYRKNPYTLEASVCTFADVFEMWKAKKYPTISASGKHGYNSAFKNSEALHKMKMRDIKTSNLDQIMQTIDAGFQVQSRLKIFWGQLFKFALEHDIVQKNYAEFVKTRDKDTGTKRTAIAPEDRAKLWEAIDAGDADAEIAMILIYTGMRPTELLEVKKENVDIEARIMIGGKKTAAGKDRRIPIHKSILPFVEKLMSQPGEMLIMRTYRGETKPMTYSHYLNFNWNNLMKRLGFTEYTPHYGRHTCATMLREANVEDDVRKLILGHKNDDITDRYTHHPDSMLVEAIDKIPERS